MVRGRKFGHPVSATTREKLRIANLGKKQSAETSSKKSVALRGNKHLLGYRLPAVAAANRRRVCSVSSREKRSISMCAFIAAGGTLRKRSRLERLLQQILDSLGLKYQRQFQLPGNPHPFDFAIVSDRILVEADGCYWHGCSAHYPNPKLQSRDNQLDEYARSLGWTVLRFKECEQVIDWSSS